MLLSVSIQELCSLHPTDSHINYIYIDVTLTSTNRYYFKEKTKKILFLIFFGSTTSRQMWRHEQRWRHFWKKISDLVPQFISRKSPKISSYWHSPLQTCLKKTIGGGAETAFRALAGTSWMGPPRAPTRRPRPQAPCRRGRCGRCCNAGVVLATHCWRLLRSNDLIFWYTCVCVLES